MKQSILKLITELKEQLKLLFTQIQEQAFYNVIKDYYQNSSKLIQVSIKYCLIVVFIFSALYLPYSVINQAQHDIDVFVEHKNLAQSLILSKTQPLREKYSKSPFDFDTLQLKIKKQLITLKLSEKQNLIIKKTKHGIKLNLNWINLKEFVDISKLLEQIHPQLKMTELKLSSEEESLYFNVIFIFKYFNNIQSIKKS